MAVGGIAGIINKSQEATATIVLDGCDVGCVKAAFEREGVDISRYIIITDLGIEKGHHFNLTDEQVETVCRAAR
ncbi:MAG: putative zinc-binding protein [Armatimonadetes bacterium]|nr:putative zinc-binding protein [Armatimonadota bacterium]